MEPRSVNPLSLDKLKSLTTERLLAYLRSLQKCEKSLEGSDWNAEEVESVKGIIFKDSNEWKEQYELVKEVLAERPIIKR